MKIGQGSGRTDWQLSGSIGETKTAGVGAAFLQVSTVLYIDFYQHDRLASSYQTFRSYLTITVGCCREA